MLLPHDDANDYYYDYDDYDYYMIILIIDIVIAAIDVLVLLVTIELLLRKVIVSKDYTRWNWDIISDLVDGPLNNTNHFESAVKSKFVKRILWYVYHICAKHRFLCTLTCFYVFPSLPSFLSYASSVFLPMKILL